MIRYVLGIDTSFDDTAVALYDYAQHSVIRHSTASQIGLHDKWKGVMPQLAGYYHLQNAVPLCSQVLREHKGPIDLICYTDQPGLVPCLVIGQTVAQTIALYKDIPLQKTNHVYGHILSVLLEHRNTMTYPYIALSVAGGHTDMYIVESDHSYQIIGQRLDDAAGECFDKAARIIEIGMYGYLIEELANSCTPDQVSLYKSLKLPVVKTRSLDFSFSGLKTAFSRFWSSHKASIPREVAAYLIQEAIIKHLLSKLDLALQYYPHVKSVALVGGVACNKPLRLSADCMLSTKHKNVRLFIPSKEYCTDNGAMICLAGIKQHGMTL